MKEPVFYQPGKTIIDFVKNGLSEVYGETLEQIQARYPGAEIGDYDTVKAEIEAGMIHPAKRITEEEWMYALETLPPMKWRNGVLSESFMMSELTYGNITAIYVRIADRFYTLQDRVSLSHVEIIRKCEA